MKRSFFESCRDMCVRQATDKNCQEVQFDRNSVGVPIGPCHMAFRYPHP